MQRTPEAAGLVVVKLRDDLRVLRLVWVGGKLDRDGLDGSGRFLAVEVFDGLLRLRPLVVADEGHTAGHACTRDRTDFTWRPRCQRILLSVASVYLFFIFWKSEEVYHLSYLLTDQQALES